MIITDSGKSYQWMLKTSEWRFDSKQDIHKVKKHFPPNYLLMTMGNFSDGYLGDSIWTRWLKITLPMGNMCFLIGFTGESWIQEPLWYHWQSAIPDSIQEETARKPSGGLLTKSLAYTLKNLSKSWKAEQDCVTVLDWKTLKDDN